MPTLTTKRGKVADGFLHVDQVDVPPKGQRFVFDDHRDAARGFGLRVTKAGGRAYILQFSMDGKQRRMTIGAHPALSLEAARAESRELVARIARGEDPLAKKAARRAEPLMRDVAEEWIAKHVSGLRSAADVEAQVRRDIIPAIGSIRVTDVRRRDIIELVERKAEASSRSAALLLGYVRQMLTFAADREMVEYNVAADLKPSSIAVAGRKNPLANVRRGRILNQDEVRAFWAGVEGAGIAKLTALALKMVLVTGQRPGEVAGLHEDEISGTTWTIPASRRGKTETAMTVPLTDLALEIINSARAENARHGRDAGLLFPVRRGGAVSHVMLSNTVRRNREALGNCADPEWGHWTPHDLRRTMRTGLAAARVRPDIAELCVGHVKGGIEGVYDRHAYDDERRAAMEAWDARLTAIIDGRDPDAQGGKVVALEVRR